VCFLILCTSSELTGEARIYANNFSTIIEYKNGRGFVNISILTIVAIVVVVSLVLAFGYH
jgi:hypothetical protein